MESWAINDIKIKEEPLDEPLGASVFVKKTEPSDALDYPHIPMLTDLLAIKAEPSSQDEELQSATIALSNHCVVKQILLCFDVPKLLEYSLVSKIWCSTARSIIRTKKNKCIVRNDGFDPCYELLMLDNILAKSTDHPFTGLSIRVCLSRKIELELETRKHYCIKNQSQTDVTETYSSILTKLPYRHLEIDWDKKSSCPATALIIHILKSKRKELTELKITYLPPSIDSVAKTLRLKASNWLPNLRILEVSDLCKINMKYELVKAAPKLEKLCGLVTIHDLGFFVQCKKVAVVQHYGFYYDDYKYDDDENEGKFNKALRDFAAAGPQLREFSFCGYRHEAWRHNDTFGESPEFINRNLRPLLESTLSSIQTIDLQLSDLLFVLPQVLSLTPMCSLKTLNLRKFEFRDRFSGKTVFEEINWRVVFPALKTVVLWITEDHEEVPQVILSGASDPRVCISESVNEIVVKARGEPFDFRKFIFESFGGLGTAFPNVKSFTLCGGLEPDKLFPFLWQTWPKLGCINLNEFPIQWRNLDPLFCGISESRAQYYCSKEMEYLLKENLRPLSPSILSLKELKTFRVEISHRRPCSWIRPVTTPKDEIFLTHVTPGLAFCKMPGLYVEIVREVCNSESVRCGYTLEHLRHYVKILN